MLQGHLNLFFCGRVNRSRIICVVPKKNRAGDKKAIVNREQMELQKNPAKKTGDFFVAMLLLLGLYF